MKPVVITTKITSNEGSLRQYIKEVNKYPLLTETELVDICNDIKNGDNKKSDIATKKLIQSNLRFVISVAKQYMRNDIQFADLINEGNIGLIIAAKKYDITMNIKFLSYAVWWIRKHILLFVGEDRMIRIPQNKVLNNQRIKKFNDSYIQQNGHEPSIEEIYKLDNLSKDDISLYQNNLNFSPISMSTPIEATDGDSEIGDIISNIDDEIIDIEVEKEHSKFIISQLLKTLKPRNKQIIIELFGIGLEEPLSIEEVGIKHNLNKERIRQLKEETLLFLRNKVEFLV